MAFNIRAKKKESGKPESRRTKPPRGEMLRLAGVVLATALLVLPGATALRCSARLWPVFGISAVAGVLGVGLGLVVSFELDWQPGPAIVLTQVAGYVVVRVVGAVFRSG